MFRKIILGYAYSPSLGDKLLAFEKELQKKLRWQIASIFAIVLAIFSVVFTSQFQPTAFFSAQQITKKSSTNNLELSSKIIYAEPLASPGSQVIFTLTAKNTSSQPQVFDFEFQTSDILEYGEILSQQNLTFDKNSGSWSPTTIAPGQSEIRQFTVKIKNKIPALYGSANSYDCKISLFFGNETSQKIQCPAVRYANELSARISKTAPQTVFVIFVVLLFVSVISALRTNLLLKQIRIIKRSF